MPYERFFWAKLHYLHVSFKDWKRRLSKGVEKRAVRYLAAELPDSPRQVRNITFVLGITWEQKLTSIDCWEFWALVVQEQTIK